MQAVRTRYFGPTNSRGSRIQAKCEAKAIFVPCAQELNHDENHRMACKALLQQLGWRFGTHGGMVGGMFNGDYYWVFTKDRYVDACEVQS